MSYKEAGVDVEAGYKAVELMKDHVRSTFREEVATDIGGFGGLFSLAKHKMEEPILVSGTDGVGTKLKVAFVLDRHDTIGIDAVAMCVNDIICAGAEPLFFLDYIACGKNVPEKIATIVGGIAEGCRQSGAALIGGETAEMPGFYPEDEYDLAGFSVGIVDKKDVIDGSRVQAGDVLLGLPSSGIHSNGYSLVRKLFDINAENLSAYNEALGATLGDALLEPTRIYVKTIQALKEADVDIKALSHVTGGGFIENIPRMLPEGAMASIQLGSWPVLPVFQVMQGLGDIPQRDMYNTFNMGIGMVAAMTAEEAEKAIRVLEARGEKAYVIGQVREGAEGVELC
ncbi:phosphoribosylformylglycinamidine cyclo-ligase [Clostridiales bacterium F-3ap]|uniref:Phosphoribosylformylglycinamidine cyclo-ligase n=1 Tax=Anaerotalea alkaliphila TaxID=2662126 RepID=A0A7X5HVC9_9FIRM|nr:phosphoribosylformylglycinamidine cyclo-ligase [Anaerotalea alkaliphila]